LNKIMGNLAVLLFSLSFAVMAAFTGCAGSPKTDDTTSLVLAAMGSFTFGGRVYAEENGETFHGDHGYAQYYIPADTRNYPLVMWHGIGQSGKTWESTPDGREGYMSILPRRDWSIYIIDQPGRGRAGRSRIPFPDASQLSTTARESGMWNAFRLGIWRPPDQAEFFDELQFPRDPDSIDQFFRWQTPDSGAPSTEYVNYSDYMVETVVDLFEQIGPGILITHSASGGLGWSAGMIAPELVKAIVAYEPGTCIFPEDIDRSDGPSDGDVTAAWRWTVPFGEFEKLTRIPIFIVYGDNIQASDDFTIDFWWQSLEQARLFVDTVNRLGGDAELMVLPEIGIHGNTHFPFSDLNNIEIADHLSDFMARKDLDGKDNPHRGPWGE
jgi:pimeloyl-ACP methyl ester carboxylesterase